MALPLGVGKEEVVLIFVGDVRFIDLTPQHWLLCHMGLY